MKNLTEAEFLFCKFQYRMEGSFFTRLIEAIMKADRPNTEKLRLGFPELVEVVWKYQHMAGYWEDLEERWKNYYTIKDKK